MKITSGKIDKLIITTENILVETSLPGFALLDDEGGFALDVPSCHCFS